MGVAATTGTSYYWNSLLNGQSVSQLHLLNLTTVNSQIPILCDKGQFHPYEPYKVNTLYADGHATVDLQFTSSTPKP